MLRKILLIMIVTLNVLGLSAQTTNVTGTVKSASGEPIFGASVAVIGTSVGASTDGSGSFTLRSVPASGVIEVSYIGYETLEVAIVANQKQYSFVLTEDSQEIDDVIVVAYGTQTKASFTGSAAVVGSEKLEKRVITNATSAFEGNTVGVQVTSATGQPGDSASIRIRGFGSVNASSSPLYVVDGAVYDGSISSINPSDIESMTILKDAASTSIYGSSAGNGVILITTKKGKEEGASVNFSLRNGWSNRSYADYQTVGVDDYYELSWQMLKNAYVTGGYDETTAAQTASEGLISTLGGYNIYSGVADSEVVGTDGKLNSAANTLKWGDDLNWEDYAFQTGYRQEYTMSYNTKGSKSDSYASISYLDDQGYLIKTDFERYTARLNYNIYPVKWLKSGINANVSRVTSNYSTSTSSSSSSYNNLVRFIRTTGSIYPVHKHDLATGDYLDAFGVATTDSDSYVYDYDGTRPNNAGRDALAETEFNSRLYQRNAQSVNTYLTINPIEGLSITSNYAINAYDYNASTYENVYVGDGAGSGRLSKSAISNISQTFNQLISYNKSIGDHSFDAMIGHENYSYQYKYLYVFKTDETVAGLYELSNFATTSSTSSYTDVYKKEGYFGRLNYNYNDKYYLSASYRHDGSSRFSAENRWGDFYSVGGSWRITQEDFAQDLNWLDDLKLRASYGETGNDSGIGYYPYQTLYDLGFLNGTEAGAYFTDLANYDLTWETQISSDVAVEFGLFGKLRGTVEYFSKSSKDLIFDVTQPYSTGVTELTSNIGKVRNSGLEIELSYDVFKNKDWRVTVGANATFAKNELVELPAEMQAEGYVSGSKKYMEGYSMYEFWLRQWAGVDPATGDGLYEFDSETYNEEDGTLTSTVEDTLVVVDGKTYTNSYSYARYDYSGTSTPKVYGGFNVAAEYKNFDISATFSYQLGGQVLDLMYASLMGVGSYGSGMHVDLLNAWQTPGDITDVPRIDANSTHSTNISQSYSTRWLVSSDYLNLRSLSLGYSLPKKFLSSAMIKNLRVSVTGENLFMLKAYDGLNPMENYSGVAYNSYMPARSFTIGVDMTF